MLTATMTRTAGAGMTIADLETELRRHGVRVLAVVWMRGEWLVRADGMEVRAAALDVALRDVLRLAQVAQWQRSRVAS